MKKYSFIKLIMKFNINYNYNCAANLTYINFLAGFVDVFYIKIIFLNVYSYFLNVMISNEIKLIYYQINQVCTQCKSECKIAEK